MKPELNRDIQQISALCQAKRWTEAKTACEKSLKKHPGNEALSSLLAGIYNGLGKPEAAIKLLSDAVIRNPANPYNYYNLAATYVALSDWKNGYAFYEALLKSIDEKHEVYTKLQADLPRITVHLFNAGNFTHAELMSRLLCRVCPENTQAWIVRALSLLRLNTTHEAETCFATALQILRTVADVNEPLSLGKLCVQHKQHTWAFQCFRRAIDLMPDSVEIYSLLLASAKRCKEFFRIFFEKDFRAPGFQTPYLEALLGDVSHPASQHRMLTYTPLKPYREWADDNDYQIHAILDSEVISEHYQIATIQCETYTQPEGLVIQAKDVTVYGKYTTVFSTNGELLHTHISMLENLYHFDMTSCASGEDYYVDIPKPTTQITAPTFLLALNNNHAHCLMDFFPTLMLLESQWELTDFHFLVPENITAQQLELLPKLGVSTERLISVAPNESVQFSELYIPSIISKAWEGEQVWVYPGLRQDTYFHIIAVSGLRYVREKILQGRPPGEKKYKIFTSRKDGARQLANSEQLEQCLVERGYHVLVLSELSMEERLHYFSNAEIVVGQLGSNLADILFAPKGACLVELSSIGKYILDFSLQSFCKAIDARFESVLCYDDQCDLQELNNLLNTLESSA